MKILELRFKNLNSLYGESLIDFTDPEYVSNGIFALTGPTGAGKSTILDAICLALYGATPRLGKITKSGNEIMSRQTGECYAEVLFESQAGRFRCHWEQRRARKKADGNLQDQEHQIADADTGRPIETKKSLVSKVIEEKTGMDFDRFTRSILLAQGGFDTFLKADVEQKSKILEQITGTGIYSEISRRVHEFYSNEREKLKLLEAETKGIMTLEPEQENEIQLDLNTKQKEETDLSDKSAKAGKAITWLNSINGMKKEINTLSEEAGNLLIQREAFKPERDKLNLAIMAASLDGSHATLTAIRKQQSDDQATLKTEKKALPGLESYAKKQAKSLNLAEQHTIKAKEELKAAAPLIQKVRFLDQKLTEQKKTVSEGEDSCKKDAAKIDVDNQARLKEQEKRIKAEKDLKLADNYLKEHAQDEWLVSALAGIKGQLDNLLSKQKEITQKKTEQKKAGTTLEHATKKLDECSKLCGIQKQDLKDTSQKLQLEKVSLNELLGDRPLREYRTEKEHLLDKKALLATIAKLKDHRAKLADGKPCPLCGAKEHPFAKGNIPMLDETEKKIEVLSKLIFKAEAQKTVIKKLEGAEVAAHKKFTDSEKLELIAASNKTAAEKTLSELNDELQKIQADFIALKLTISANLQPLGITEIPNDNVSSLIESLKARLNAWQTQVKKQTEIAKQIVCLDSEITSLNAIIKTQTSALDEKRERLETLKKEHSAKSDERKTLYGDKKPDEEERRLNKVVADAEETEKMARTQHNELQQELNTAKTNVEFLNKRINQSEPELKKAEADFSTALASSSFSNEKQFLEARLTTEQRDALSTKAKKLDDGQADLMARQKDRKARLDTELAKMVTGKTLEELEPEYKEHEDSLKQLRDTIASLKHRLKENTTAKERVKNKQAAIEAQKKECHRWEKLHSLIGSADGKKYRNFAQGITFELMVSHANRQLEKMTDRYLLIRDDEQPLTLNVFDKDQAGEIRSTKNLSGGESFIVSLTLALGLSQMASRRVRVDSLFLDEGFGTLDDGSLETALETLSTIQQDGKLIGIISHVPALKERIRTQLNIIKHSGGRSSITGPGARTL